MISISSPLDNHIEISPFFAIADNELTKLVSRAEDVSLNLLSLIQ